MESNSKWKVTQNGVSLKMECHSKRNFTNELNVTQKALSLKKECQIK